MTSFLICGFRWSPSDSKSPKIFGNLLIILSNLSKTAPFGLSFNSDIQFNYFLFRLCFLGSLLWSVSLLPLCYGNLFSSLTKSMYLLCFFFLFVCFFTLWYTGTAKLNRLFFLFFFYNWALFYFFLLSFFFLFSTTF